MESRALEALRVLILEDELLIALELEQFCLDAGCAGVSIFTDPDEVHASGIDLADFDIAVIDVMVGDKTTLPFATKLVALEIPFIFATGLSASEDVFRAFENVPVVSKPYAHRELLEALDRVSPLRLERS